MRPQFGKHYEWTIVLVLALTYGMTSFDRWLLPTLFPVIGGDLGIGVGELSTITATMSAVFGVFALLVGTGSDRWGRKPVMVVSVVVFSICSVLTGVTTGLVALLALRVVLGAAEGSFVPTMYSATIEGSHPNRRGLNMGLVICAFPMFGLGLGPIVATQLLGVLPSWEWVFTLSAVPGIILAVLIARRHRAGLNYCAPTPTAAVESTPAAKFDLGALLLVLRCRNLVIAVAATVLSLVAMFVLGGLIPTYLTDSVGVSVQDMGFIASAVGFGGFAGQLILAGLSDSWGRRPALLLESLGAAVFSAAITQVGDNPVALFVTLFGSAFFTFALLSLVGGPVVAEAAPHGLLGAANGLVVGGGEIIGSGILAAIVGNVVASAGLDLAPWLAAGGMALAALLGIGLKETAPRVLARRAGISVAGATDLVGSDA